MSTELVQETFVLDALQQNPQSPATQLQKRVRMVTLKGRTSCSSRALDALIFNLYCIGQKTEKGLGVSQATR